MSAIISSHQLYELASIVERVLVLNKAKIVYDGIPDYDREMNIILDKDYIGNLNDDIGIQNNKIVTNYQGDKLDNLIKILTRDYKIIDIKVNKSNLEKFFWGD